MYIVIAPSKTMTTTATKGTTTPLFLNHANDLLAWLKTQSVAELQTLFAVNESIAQENYERFQDFDPKHHALFAYTGHQFKHLDAQGLSAEAQTYLNTHLFIMSGLYGLVKPTDTIGHYRLPMGVKKDGVFLKDVWKPLITKHLHGETIINLASKEYTDAIDHHHVNMIDIVFKKEKKGKLTSHAMENKKMRGKFIHHMATNQIKTLDALKSVRIDGYAYQSSMSAAQTLVFVKPEK